MRNDAGITTAFLGLLFLTALWGPTHPNANAPYELWSTDLRACIIGCFGAGCMWGTAQWYLSNKPEGIIGNAFFAAIFGLLLFLTTTCVTGLLRQLGDRELPCVEWSQDTCKVCVEEEDVNNSAGSGPNYQCVDWEYEDCQICVARRTRVDDP